MITINMYYNSLQCIFFTYMFNWYAIIIWSSQPFFCLFVF